ncbi:hypothetical protein [Stutzerimonas kunmingensis]|uniref:hypothetical protein n=1 Tax=Stutzerimonas kunmingensis TaxID=1211807 RepID=UPI0028AFFADD|nr:hypothetical protein [Stutzerimonas kunmingensis]
MEEITTEADPRVDLENKSAFVKRREIWGIPSEIFIGAMTLAVFGVIVMMNYFGFFAGFVAGLMLALIILVPVYLIHRNDPDGAMVWVRSLWSPESYDPCVIKRRKVLLIKQVRSGLVVESIHSEGKYQ